MRPLVLLQYLPEDPDYSPPIELKVIDHREFGYKPVVGQAAIRNLSQYICDPWEASKSHSLPVRGAFAGDHIPSAREPCSPAAVGTSITAVQLKVAKGRGCSRCHSDAH